MPNSAMDMWLQSGEVSSSGFLRGADGASKGLVISEEASREIQAQRQQEFFRQVIAPMVNQIGINAWTFANQQAGAYRYVFRANVKAAKEASEKIKEAHDQGKLSRASGVWGLEEPDGG